MSWNYRIIQRENHVALHEVYYGNEGNLIGWTEDPVSFIGDDPDDLIKSLEMALNDARQKPRLVV